MKTKSADKMRLGKMKVYQRLDDESASLHCASDENTT